MAYVVPRMQSILFDGTNNAVIEAIVTDPVWQLVQSNEERVRWQAVGESEPYFRTVNAGEWMLYQPSSGGTAPVQGMSDEEYTKWYREVDG